MYDTFIRHTLIANVALAEVNSLIRSKVLLFNIIKQNLFM